MLGASAVLLPRVVRAQGAARVVVVGGGFAGATCARELQRTGDVAVTLVEANPTFTACPFSNNVIAGLRHLREQQFGYEGLRRAGVAVVHQSATRVDAQGRRVTLGDGTSLDDDRLGLVV